MGERLDDDVDRVARERALERGALGLEVAGENKIGRDALVEPAPALDPIEGLRGPVDCCFAERFRRWIGDERGDEDGRHDASRRAGQHVRRALLIAGPTASGKSAAALALAQAFGATIVNANSMQVYRDLRVLTARPTPDEERLAPHRLFGAIDGAVNFSAGRWALAAGEILAEIGEQPVIFVGGTGLYFRALTEGLSDIPPVPEAVRAEIRTKAEGRATPELHDELQASDPKTAARLNPSDRQRILRALEVIAATGRPLVSFLGARAAPALRPGEWAGLYLAPDRAELGRRIDARFDAMLARGALDEVATLMQRRLDPALPVMRAHGVPHLIGLSRRPAHARRGRVTLEARHPPLRQAAVHLGAPPALWLPMGRARGGGRTEGAKALPKRSDAGLRIAAFARHPANHLRSWRKSPGSLEPLGARSAPSARTNAATAPSSAHISESLRKSASPIS